MTAKNQGELEGMRPKRLLSLEHAVENLLDAKDQQKQAKQVVDAASAEVANALKAAELTTYGWKENGRTVIVSVEDKELVKVQTREPKAKRAAKI